MSELISESEAKRVGIAVVTAMLQNDKVAREAVYADYTEEDLKRVIRWITRWLILHVGAVAGLTGHELEDYWKSFALMLNASMEE